MNQGYCAPETEILFEEAFSQYILLKNKKKIFHSSNHKSSNVSQIVALMSQIGFFCIGETLFTAVF